MGYEVERNDYESEDEYIAAVAHRDAVDAAMDEYSRATKEFSDRVCGSSNPELKETLRQHDAVVLEVKSALDKRSNINMDTMFEYADLVPKLQTMAEQYNSLRDIDTSTVPYDDVVYAYDEAERIRQRMSDMIEDRLNAYTKPLRDAYNAACVPHKAVRDEKIKQADDVYYAAYP